jgi:NAD(P)-dependent dehydrogenase (short-subunit alcohol dehydrogenase family)
MDTTTLFRLDGRIAIVTGAARGIGQCIAQALGQLGASVVLADKLPLVHETAATIARSGASAEGVVLDVTDRATVDAAIDGVAARWGKIDALVANAGWSYEDESVNHTDENWLQAMDINLNGVFYTIRRTGRHMVAQGSGAIVGISSIAGVKYVRPEHHVGYDVAKAGVAHMCRVLGCEWAPSGVRVNAVGPGYTDTEMLAEVGRTRPEVMQRWIDDIPMRRLLKREEIASSIAFLLSDAASGITGQLIMVDAGYSAA